MKIRPRSAAFAALAVAIAVYTALCLRHLLCPGLGYDEVNWANIALGEIDDSWITQRLFGHPFLLALPYVGALKGYLMRPVFSLFGISVASIRVPGILMGAACLGFLFAIVRRLTRTWGAPAVAVLLCALNPEFIQRMRQDLGPVAIDLFCKDAALLSILFLTESFSTLGLLGVAVLCALGLWNKLTFIWYINAFAVAGALTYRQIPRERKSLSQVALGSLCFAAFLGYTAWVYSEWRIGSIDQGQTFTYAGRLLHFAGQLRQEITGLSSINHTFDPYDPTGTTIWALLQAALIVLGIWSLLQPSTQSRPRLFVAISAVATVTQIAFTKAAIFPWHSFAIEPFATILLVEGTMFAGYLLFRRTRPALTFPVLFGAAALHSGRVLTHYDAVACGGRTTGVSFDRTSSSMAIYPLVDFSKSHPHTQLALFDWGMQTQLMLLGPNPRLFIDHAQAVSLLPALLDRPDTLFVMHTPEATAVPMGHDALLNAASRHGTTLQPVQAISDGFAPVIQIFRAVSTTSTRPLPQIPTETLWTPERRLPNAINCIVSAIPGGVRIVASNVDPQLLFPLGPRLGDFRTIVVKAKFSVSDDIEAFFGQQINGRGYKGENAIVDRWVDVIIPVGSNPFWKNEHGAALRFDPTSGKGIGSVTEIKAILGSTAEVPGSAIQTFPEKEN